MSKQGYEYHVVKYGYGYLGKWFSHETYEKVDFLHAESCTYEEADRLAKLYGGKVKKVVTYIEDVKGYE